MVILVSMFQYTMEFFVKIAFGHKELLNADFNRYIIKWLCLWMI